MGKNKTKKLKAEKLRQETNDVLGIPNYHCPRSLMRQFYKYGLPFFPKSMTKDEVKSLIMGKSGTAHNSIYGFIIKLLDPIIGEDEIRGIYNFFTGNDEGDREQNPESSVSHLDELCEKVFQQLRQGVVCDGFFETGLVGDHTILSLREVRMSDGEVSYTPSRYNPAYNGGFQGG